MKGSPSPSGALHPGPGVLTTSSSGFGRVPEVGSLAWEPGQSLSQPGSRCFCFSLARSSFNSLLFCAMQCHVSCVETLRVLSCPEGSGSGRRRWRGPCLSLAPQLPHAPVPLFSFSILPKLKESAQWLREGACSCRGPPVFDSQRPCGGAPLAPAHVWARIPIGKKNKIGLGRWLSGRER